MKIDFWYKYALMGCSKHASEQVSFLVRNPQKANLTLLSGKLFHARRWRLDCNESYIIVTIVKPLFTFWDFVDKIDGNETEKSFHFGD